VSRNIKRLPKKSGNGSMAISDVETALAQVTAEMDEIS
jgi:hypothetical protein